METVDPILKNSLASVNMLETDFLGEFVAASLVAAGFPDDKTLLLRREGDKRYVSKDIGKIELNYSFFDMEEYLHVYLNRPGIYDALPEGIFHDLRSYGALLSKEEVIREIRRHREKELFARKFFAPFEMVVDKLLTAVQQYEQKFDRAYLYGDLKDIFEEQWSLFRLLDLGQALLLLRIIPIIPEVSLEMERAGKVFSVLLGVNVVISEGQMPGKVRVEDDELIKLYHWKLGYNSNLGCMVRDVSNDLIVTIGPLSPEEMKSFGKGHSNDLILWELIDLILPFGRNIRVKYRVKQQESSFRLSGKSHKAYLGINTSL